MIDDIHIDYPTVFLKRGKEIAVKRHHHWIFSGAIDRFDSEPTDDCLVQVKDNSGNHLGVGHYQDGSIAIRLLSFEKDKINRSFWVNRITQSLRLREASGLTKRDDLNAYRVIHGEGDFSPGLIIDRYDEHFVIQTHSKGMHRAAGEISDAILEVFPEAEGIYHKFKSKDDPSGTQGVSLFGSSNSGMITEYGHLFRVDWQKGQKTGFFLDQRENRKILAGFCKGKKVLNAFSYTGGFSIYALKAGAKHAVSVDASSYAIDCTVENASLNEVADKHEGVCSKLVPFLNEVKNKYDVIILDPPAFAKRLSAKAQAVKGYRLLNERAFQHLNPGGVLFTFSCSQVIDRNTFRSSVLAAASRSGRRFRVLQELTQPADHPVNMFHPESFYLKGLILYID